MAILLREQSQTDQPNILQNIRPKRGIDPPFAESNNLLNAKVDALMNQATTAGLSHLNIWE